MENSTGVGGVGGVLSELPFASSEEEAAENAVEKPIIGRVFVLGRTACPTYVVNALDGSICAARRVHRNNREAIVVCTISYVAGAGGRTEGEE